jgi:integrase
LAHYSGRLAPNLAETGIEASAASRRRRRIDLGHQLVDEALDIEAGARTRCSSQTCVGAALRREAAWGWLRVDFQNRLVTDTKNGEARHVYLNDAMFEALDALATRLDGRLLPLGPSQTTMLFVRAARRAGLEDCRLHDLRHTFASYQAMSGMASRGLQSLLGHKEPAYHNALLAPLRVLPAEGGQWQSAGSEEEGGPLPQPEPHNGAQKSAPI